MTVQNVIFCWFSVVQMRLYMDHFYLNILSSMKISNRSPKVFLHILISQTEKFVILPTKHESAKTFFM